MLHPVSAPNGATAPNYSDRIGFAQLTRRAFEGGNLHPLREKLLARIEEGTAEAGEGLDLSLIAQLLGEKEAGLVIQTEVLAFHQLFRTPCAAPKPGLRVLALAADIDMGGNTPIEFLLEGSDIELLTLYVVKGVGLPATLPEHDHVWPWSVETAVFTFVSSDHAYQSVPSGATDTLGKLWSRSLPAVTEHGIGWSVNVLPPSLDTATNASSKFDVFASCGATNAW